jgi:sulfur carrier protein ThiS adenylyltransferase
MDNEIRYSRQRDIVPADRLSGCKITIIGVGAIGRQVALQLAAMGAPSLQLVDFDIVDESNLASQGYLQDDLASPKVQATAKQCLLLNHDLTVIEANERFRRSMDVGNVIFCCVDKIAARSLIWEAVKNATSFFADMRMSAEVVRILAAANEESRRHYPTTLFAAEEAHVGSCTAKSTLYSANIAAGLAIGQFTKWLRGLPVDCDLSLNILASELSCS